MYELYDLYFKLRAKTEPPAILHRWSLLGCLGAWLGRQAWLPFGSSRILPNQYIMMVADPGARKTTAIRGAQTLLQQAGFEAFAPKKSSKEKFLLDLMEGEEGAEDSDLGKFNVLATTDTSPRECFIVADEFNVFAGRGNMDFFEILGDMWDWDSETHPWKYRLKNSKSVEIWQPTISILGGNTPTGFAECFPLAMIGQGFMSRLLLIYTEAGEYKNPWPPTPDAKLIEELIAILHKIKRTVIGPFQVDEEAHFALETIYRAWVPIDDVRFKHYSSRRHQHLLKLCILHAAMRYSTTINKQDVVVSNTILSYAEMHMPKAMGELGKSRSSEAANKVMQVLYAAKAPKSLQELWPAVRMDLEKVSDLAVIISNLLQADKVQQIEIPGGKHGYLAKQKILSNRVLYIDQRFLSGKELP